MPSLETLQERVQISREKFRTVTSKWLPEEDRFITIEANAYSYQVTFAGDPWCESENLELILDVFTRYVESYNHLYNSGGLTPVIEC